MRNIGYYIAVLVPFAAYADPTSSKWSNEIELGFLLNRGNTYNTHFDGRYSNQYHTQRWENKFSMAAFLDLGFDQDIQEKRKTAEKYSAKNHVNFSLSRAGYLYVKAEGIHDKFSSFDYELSDSIGYGHKIIDSDRMRWLVEMGPGSRHTRSSTLAQEKIYQTELIGHAATEWRYTVTPRAEFSQTLIYNAGEKNQKTNLQSSLKAKVWDKVALKLSHNLEYNAKLPETGKKHNHTDNATTLTATYVF